MRPDRTRSHSIPASRGLFPRNRIGRGEPKQITIISIGVEGIDHELMIRKGVPVPGVTNVPSRFEQDLHMSATSF